MDNQKLYMLVPRQYFYDFYALYRFVITFVSLTFRIVLVIFQLFLHNLENRLKFDILATKTKDHHLTKMVLQVVSIHVSRLLCC